MKARHVPKLGTREKVPRDVFPNYRDSGKTVDRELLNVLASLQRRYGEAFASEAGLRRMMCEDGGHMPGVDTLPTALERLEAQGVLVQQWLRPGGILPDGRVCTYGTRLVSIPKCRRERLTLGARNRRETVSGRADPRFRVALDQARANVARRMRPDPLRGGTLDRERDAALAALRELEAQWDAQGAKVPPDKPPD